MATEVYRTYRAWEEAIALGLQVHSLIESLPAEERSVLAVSLNAAIVRIPSMIALNLMSNQPADITEVISLQNQIELVNRIYPALDAADIEQSASQLLTRMQDESRFRETIPVPEPPQPPAVQAEPDVATAEEPEEDESEGAAEASQPTTVRIQPE